VGAPRQSGLPFLGEVLNSAEEESWQQALDGLVTFASQEALRVLQQAHSRLFENESDRKRFVLWLNEAIEQVQDTLKK
jgi:hypothetical protein